MATKKQIQKIEKRADALMKKNLKISHLRGQKENKKGLK